jgi:3-hydroxyisobutyrate dehydrogenase
MHRWFQLTLIWIFKAAKICNNMAMAISMLGVSEAFALGQNLGIKASTLTDIFNCSSARCWSRYCPSHLFYCSSNMTSFLLQFMTYKVHHLKFVTLYDLFADNLNSDTYNPVPGVLEGVPSSRNYDGGFTSKLMVWFENVLLVEVCL